MRFQTLLFGVTSLLVLTAASAEPVPRNLAVANPNVRERSIRTERDKLITLERSATNDAKDKILDVLLRMGAVVKQTYDYRVFKGILFSIPRTDDEGLTSWQASLGKQDGVKYVEEDSIVKVQ